VPLEECKQLWEANRGVDYPDVSLPNGWYLNCARVSIPPVLEEGPDLDAEIHCRIQDLPEPLSYRRK
jgi:hypothetical protein